MGAHEAREESRPKGKVTLQSILKNAKNKK
jgi:hypothetical protein